VYISKTSIPRHKNVTQHVSSKKQLSTKTADRHTHARSYHHALEVAGVTFSDADSAPDPKYLNPGAEIFQI